MFNRFRPEDRDNEAADDITHTPVKTKRTMSLALKPSDGRGLKTASR